MALTNYRCFAQRQDIELRPITIVLGKNNSGKSALVRAPVVIRTGIHTDSPAPLDLDVLDEDMLESFTDLVYGGRLHGSVGIELSLSTGIETYKLSATVQNIDEYRTQVVSKLELLAGEQHVRLAWEQAEPTANLWYSATANEHSTSHVPVLFRGLLPSSVQGKVPDELSRFQPAIDSIRRSYPVVRYFGPFRDRPRRRYRLPARMPADIGTTGERAAEVIASDFSRQRGRLVAHINSTMADNLAGWDIEVVEQGGAYYSVVLTSREDPTLRVNLADTGAGVAQVLPIFVQRAMDELDPPDRPVLEIIEQPELHLHPAAHGVLADLYVQAIERTTVRFLVETHSETLLLRVRRRIAEGVLDPDSVAIYFVEHSHGAANARRIEVDADGNLDYWPAGVFSEDYEETRELAAAQQARGDADAR
jgi:predicted ATPase